MDAKAAENNVANEESGYVLDDQVGYILRLASQRHAVIFQEHAILDLTPTQFAALVRIAEIDECSQNLLGRLTAMDAATIKGVVDRLTKKGLVEHKPHPSDKRRTLISLTQTGKDAVDDLHAMGTEISAKTLNPLTANEQKTLLRLLRKMT